MKFIDLFAGIGGFRLGMERAGHEPVGWCEEDKFAQKSYRAIHDTKGEWFADDITDVQPGELPEFECITAGFPCQSFSVAGKRGGFEDTRGTLFFEVARLAKERQPRLLLLENVKGLLSHNGGETFGAILNTLQQIGYGFIQWQMLNSKDFGVPQNRERVFIVASLGEECRPEVFPIRKVSENGCEQVVNVEGLSGNESIKRVYSPEGTSPTITNCQGGHREPFIMAMRGRYKEDDEIEQKLEPRKDKVTNTLTGVQKDNLVCKQGKVRKLTPKECWRLQGFPDWSFKKAEEVNSDTQLYRQAGNSVSIPVVHEIAKRLD